MVTVFTCVMLASAGISDVVSVCHTAGIVSKHLNVESSKQRHVIAQGLYFSDADSRWWGCPIPPEICNQSDPTPFQI